MRRLRRVVLLGALALALLPMVFLALAHGYERWLERRCESLLRRHAATMVAAGTPDMSAAVADGVEVVLLDRTGAIAIDSKTGERAVSSSFVGGVAERVLQLVAGDAHRDGTPAPLHPSAAAPEIARALAGETVFVGHDSTSHAVVVFALAAPRSDGGVVYLAKASRRGIRRLVVVRHELYKLLAYQLPFTLVVALLFGYWVVRPIEHLERAAHDFPQRPIAETTLLDRTDEIGALARAITLLARTLEDRRRATADMGADIAHELKNPLATIFASAELIGTTRDATPEKRQMVAESIIGAVERLRHSLDALMNLLALEAKIGEEARVAVDYRALIEAVLDEVRRDPRYHDFVLRLAIADDVPSTVNVVPARWQELLRNLFDNALVQPTARRELFVRVERAKNGSLVTAIRDYAPASPSAIATKFFAASLRSVPQARHPARGSGFRSYARSPKRTARPSTSNPPSEKAPSFASRSRRSRRVHNFATSCPRLIPTRFRRVSHRHSRLLRKEAFEEWPNVHLTHTS